MLKSKLEKSPRLQSATQGSSGKTEQDCSMQDICKAEMVANKQGDREKVG